MLELIKQPWSWWAAGIVIGLTVPTLLIVGNKSFGISSSLRHICAMCIPAKIPFFNYDWKNEIWNLLFVVGTLLGGFIAVQFLQDPEPIKIAEVHQTIYHALGIAPDTNYDIEKRPFYTTPDGKGKVQKELLA